MSRDAHMLCRLGMLKMRDWRIDKARIVFRWIEPNRRRDKDNVAFAKKFILDALVKAGKLKDDNRNCVIAFTDNFEYTKEFKIVLEIEEIECEKRN